MSPRAEAWRRRLAGRTIAVAMVMLAAMPIYVSLSATWRAVFVRLACGALVAGGTLRALGRLRRVLDPVARSRLPAGPPPPPALELDARFLALRDDIVSSIRSRRYFDVILWPRLGELARREVPRPARRPGLLARRGPALATLEELVAEVEREA